MDRGIPTEETLEQMRTGDSPVHYLVGTPKGRLSKFENEVPDPALASRAPVGRRSSSCPMTRSSTSWLEAIPFFEP